VRRRKILFFRQTSGEDAKERGEGMVKRKEKFFFLSHRAKI
jgi:hypothetical protein